MTAMPLPTIGEDWTGGWNTTYPWPVVIHMVVPEEAMDRRASAIAIMAALLGLALGSPIALAQNPPANPPARDPAAPAGSQACAPPLDQRPSPETRGQAGDNLSDRLSRSGGVICPPSDGDPAFVAPPPGGGRTPVIPPPGGPGGDPTVRPK